MPRTLIRIAFLLLFACGSAAANITVPVTKGGSPTCVGLLYTNILIPSGWGTDNDAATRFAQSPEGTLGITMFFEIGPYGDGMNYDSNGTGALLGVGYTSINRFRNNDSVVNINFHGEKTKGGIIAIIKESQAWHHESYHGEGTLLETQRNRFYSILNGDPNSLDCGGLLYSWVAAQNFIQTYWGITGKPPFSISVTPSTAYSALFYMSVSDTSSTSHPGLPSGESRFLQIVNTWTVPRFPSGQYYEEFWTLTNAVPDAYSAPFI